MAESYSWVKFSMRFCGFGVKIRDFIFLHYRSF